jgi:Flp pilus assembly pilin Flp
MKEEKAVAASEYAVMLGLVILATISAIHVLGGGVNDAFLKLSDEVPIIDGGQSGSGGLVIRTLDVGSGL